MIKTKFKLGPIQEEWLRRLEAHPEKQLDGRLGINIGMPEEKCCCLGEALLTLHQMRGTEPEVVGCNLIDGNDEEILMRSYEELGLLASDGESRAPITREGKRFWSLSRMNDGGITWPEIAAEIRKNPENFFTKSV